MPDRLIAIGDIHGCAAALDGLLDAIAPTAADRLVLLGDYVDRGPESSRVLETVLRLEQELDVVALMGNHEEMMLGVINRRSPIGWWFRYGGRETMASYGPNGKLSSIPQEHVDLLRRLADYHEEADHLFVHASYVPSEPLSGQPVEALRWTNVTNRSPAMHCSGKTAVVGHTSQKSGEVLDRGHVVCVDTFCVGGKWLTGMDVLTGQVWQVDPDGRPRSA